MKKISLSIALLLISCKTVSYKDVNPIIKDNQKKLLLKNAITNVYNIERIYDTSYTNFVVEGNTQRIKDARIDDTKRLFFKWAEQMANYDPDGDYGYMVFRLNSVSDEKRLDVLEFFSIVLLGAPTLLGIPYSVKGYRIEGELLIFDKNDRLVKRYIEDAYNSEYVAMYYGYTADDAKRKVALDCIKEILEKIRVRVQKDYPILVKKLNK